MVPGASRLARRGTVRAVRRRAADQHPLQPTDLGPVLSRSPGEVVLELEGRAWRLDSLMDDERKRLFILFGDATNRDETYGAGRFLYTPLPDPASGGRRRLQPRAQPGVRVHRARRLPVAAPAEPASLPRRGRGKALPRSRDQARRHTGLRPGRS